MKVCAISKDGIYFKIGESNDDSRWYTATDKVSATVKSIAKGDLVDVKYEVDDTGKRLMTSITKTGSAPASSYTKPSGSSSGYSGGFKSPEVQESIKRQAIGNMTSRGLIALQGQVDINNICSVAETLYNKFRELVG